MINSDLLTPFGRLIRGARLKRELTTGEVAKSINMSRRKVEQYERGELLPGRRASIMLARLYEIPLEEFFQKMEEKENLR